MTSPVPTVTCDQCGRKAQVVPDGRGFPPDIAKSKLRRLCRADGCQGEPEYRAGFVPGSRPRGQVISEHDEVYGPNVGEAY